MAFILPEESMAIIMSIPSLIISFVLLLSDGLARAKIRKKKARILIHGIRGNILTLKPFDFFGITCSEEKPIEGGMVFLSQKIKRGIKSSKKRK